MSRKNRKLKRTFRIILILVCILIFVALCATGYRVMYDVFADEPVSESSSVGVVVRIDSDMNTYEIGKRLEDEGLVKSAFVFTVQAKLFTQSGKSLLPGTYSLNSSMTAEEIIEILEVGDDASGDASDSEGDT